MKSNQTNNQLTQKMTYWSGPAGIIGGLAVGTAYLLHPSTALPDMVASTFWISIHALFMISLICGIFLLIMLAVQYIKQGGSLRGIIGCGIGILSMVLIISLDYAEMFIFPVLADTFPEVILKYGDGVAMPSLSFVFPLTGLLFLLGYSLFSYELYRTETVDKWAAQALFLSVILFVAGLSGLLSMMVVKVGAVLFGLSLIWVSLSLMEKVNGWDDTMIVAEAELLNRV